MALVGTEMDWVEDDLRAEFVFNNPNSKVNKLAYSRKKYNLFLNREHADAAKVFTFERREY